MTPRRGRIAPMPKKITRRPTPARRITRPNYPLLDDVGERAAPPYRRGAAAKDVMARSGVTQERRGWVLFRGARNGLPYVELWDDQGLPDGGVYVYRWYVGDANDTTVHSLVARVQADIEIALDGEGFHELDPDFEVLTRAELKRRWGKLFGK